MKYLNGTISKETSTFFQSFTMIDNIEFQPLTSTVIEEAMYIIRNIYLKKELVAVGLGVANNPAAVQELEGLFREAALDGLSIVALDKTTKQVAGLVLNKLRDKNNPSQYYRVKNYKQQASGSYIKYVNDMETSFNLYSYHQTDHIVELMCLAIRPEYSNKRIAQTLSTISVELLKRLKNGCMMKTPIYDHMKLELEPIPTVLSCYCISPYVVRITQKLGWKIFGEFKYNDYKIDGKALASKINSTTGTTIMYLIL